MFLLAVVFSLRRASSAALSSSVMVRIDVRRGAALLRALISSLCSAVKLFLRALFSLLVRLFLPALLHAFISKMLR